MEDEDAFISWHEKCPGCERLEQERDNVPEGSHGVHFRLLPRDVAIQMTEAQA